MSIKDQIEKVCISPNSDCNFSCRYCYFFNPENCIIPKTKLSINEIKTILEKIYNYSNKIKLKKRIKVIFVGSGEPLLSWKEISLAVEDFIHQKSDHKLKFYMVTNGSLITDEIAKKMKELEIKPSISLDGPESIHNQNRVILSGKPTFKLVMKGVEILRKNDFEIIINPTLSWELINNLDQFFEFILEQQIDKIIIGRLVDAPSFYPAISYEKFYDTLTKIYELTKKFNLNNKEIGNIEAYRKAVLGDADKVCTLIGSCCGAGTSNIIYLQRDVYPCGRMFDKKQWYLGNYDQDIEVLQSNMIRKLNLLDDKCYICKYKNICIRDCILESLSHHYDCKARKSFLKKMKLEFEA